MFTEIDAMPARSLCCCIALHGVRQILEWGRAHTYGHTEVNMLGTLRVQCYPTDDVAL